MLVEPSPQDAATRPIWTGVSVERTAQVAGLQAILLPIITAPLLFVVDSDRADRELGLGPGARAIAAIVAVGLRFIADPDVSARDLARRTCSLRESSGCSHG